MTRAAAKSEPTGTQGTVSLWSAADVPDSINSTDGVTYELGLKFQVLATTNVLGMKFYKGSLDTGVHTGTLWSSDGAVLATVTFANETASGWQTAWFSSPISIAADTTYVISYYATSMYYCASTGNLVTPVTSGILVAPGTNAANGNGVFRQDAHGFPNNSWNATNYFVDVIVEARPVPDRTPPDAPVINAGGTTTSLTPTLTGTAEAASTITLTVNAHTYTAQTAADGTWSVTITDPLTANQTYPLSVTATDTAGNVSLPTSLNLHTVTPPTLDTALPSAITGLKLWLKADAITGVSNGGIVSSWPDSSGNNTPANAAAGEEPTLITNASNGLPVVRFDGSRALWSNAVASYTSQTVIAVIKPTVSSSSSTTIRGGAIQFFVNSDGKIAVNVQSVTSICESAASVSQSNYQVVAFTYAAGSVYGMWVNSLADRSGATTVSITNDNSITAIGRNSNWAESFLGDIAEIACYDRVIAIDEINAVMKGLNTKWGITPPIDTTPPAAPTVTSSLITSSTTPDITGRAEIGALVDVQINGRIYTTKTDSVGGWSVTVADSLAIQDYQLVCSATDPAGNQSPVLTTLLSVVSNQTAANDNRNYTQQVLADSPSAYYAFQEMSGTVANDWSTHARHGSFRGDVVPNEGYDPYFFAPVAVGRHIQCINIVDGNAYVLLPQDILSSSTGFTFECWLRTFGWGWCTQLFSLIDANGNNYAGLIRNGYDNTLHFTMGGPGVDFPLISQDEWHHIVCTATGSGTGTVYIDGIQVASGNVGTFTTTPRPHSYLGKGEYGGVPRASWAQVAFYPTALSAARVTAHYNAGLADDDPVWHGPPETWDPAYFSQFTNGAQLANPALVPMGDWMSGWMESAQSTNDQFACFNVAINGSIPSNEMQRVGMMSLPYVDNGLTIPPTSEVVGYILGDEFDHGGEAGLASLRNVRTHLLPGYMGYVNFGIMFTQGQGSPTLTTRDYSQYCDMFSVDLYFYTADPNGGGINQFWGIPNAQIRRSVNYGVLQQRARTSQVHLSPQWGFVEIGHPGGGYSCGGPNPDQIEGAVWGCLIGGARGVIWFHHNFAETDASGVIDPPAWNAATDYPVGSCVDYNGTWYYAALKPSVGQVPEMTSYTWCHFSAFSGASLDNPEPRHPDTIPRLMSIKTKLQALAPAINSPTTMHLLHRNLYSTYRPNALDGKKYIFAIPGLDAPNGGTFDMYVPKGQSPSNIEVVGESRSIPTFSSGGRLKFTDTFAAEYSHHVYRWT